MIVLPVVFSLTAFGMTLCGGLLAVKLRDRLGILTAFAAGVLIAVPLFDLLPEAISIAETVGMPVTVLLTSGNSLRSSLRILLLDASMPVLGAVSALFIKVPESYLALILSFFAGGFLYLGAGGECPERFFHRGR